MSYVLRMPQIVIDGATARIEAVYVRAGDAIARGTRLFDFSLDLGARYAQICPPITYHRAVAHETGHLRNLTAEPGSVFEANADLGLVGLGEDACADSPASRPFRVVVAGIVWRPDMWSASSLA